MNSDGAYVLASHILVAEIKKKKQKNWFLTYWVLELRKSTTTQRHSSLSEVIVKNNGSTQKHGIVLFFFLFFIKINKIVSY